MVWLGLVLAMLGPLLIAELDKRFMPPGIGIAAHLLGLAGLVAIAVAVLLIVLLDEHQSLASLGLQPPSWAAIIWGAALTAFFVYVFAPAAYWALRRFRLGSFDSGIAKNTVLPIWYLVLAVLIGGTVEELLYRGYAVERIAGLTGSYWIGGTVSVLIFGIAHVPMWGWGPALTTLVSGAVFTIFFIWQRDLTANIIAHVATDMIGIVITPWLRRRT